MVRTLLPAAQVPLTRRCRYAVSAAIVPVVVIGPPVRPVPVATFVTVPVPPATAQIHALPFHCGTWFVAHAAVGNNCVAASPIVPVVVIGPPVSPAPVATLVTVPPATWSRHAAAFTLIVPACATPFATSRFDPHAFSTPDPCCCNPVPLRVTAVSRT